MPWENTSGPPSVPAALTALPQLALIRLAHNAAVHAILRLPRSNVSVGDVTTNPLAIVNGLEAAPHLATSRMAVARVVILHADHESIPSYQIALEMCELFARGINASETMQFLDLVLAACQAAGASAEAEEEYQRYIARTLRAP